MTHPADEPTPSFSIAEVERETGLSRDTLRMWERRYGFPSPQPGSSGSRVYPAQQVERLRVIRRLIAAGHRPGRILTLDTDVLRALSSEQIEGPGDPRSAVESGYEMESCLSLIRAHDVQALRRHMSQSVSRLGLRDFITGVIAPMNAAVGDCWAQGSLQVFEEHLYTDSVKSVLRTAISGIPASGGKVSPRVMLTTLPDEPHGLGLLMVEAIMDMEGCLCMQLGTQTPMHDIGRAAQEFQTDIVALSFTTTLDADTVVQSLREVVGKLPPQVEVWAGGHCPVLYQQQIPGVLCIRALESLPEELALWRTRSGHAPGSLDATGIFST